MKDFPASQASSQRFFLEVSEVIGGPPKSGHKTAGFYSDSGHKIVGFYSNKPSIHHQEPSIKWGIIDVPNSYLSTKRGVLSLAL